MICSANPCSIRPPQTAPETQGRSGQDGAPVENRVSSLGEAGREYRLTAGCATSSHLQTVSRPPATVGSLSRLLSAACPRSPGKFDEKSGLGAGARADGVVVFERPAFKQANETLFVQIAESGAVDKPALAPVGFGISTFRGGSAYGAGENNQNH